MNEIHLEHELFLLMLHLSQLSTRSDVVSAFVEALDSLWPERSFRFTDEPVGEEEAITIATADGSFGSLHLDQESPLPPLEQALLRNAA